MTTTDRLGLPLPVGGDPPSALRSGINALSKTLDSVGLVTSGLLVARPAEGTFGRWYLATDDFTSGHPAGTLWFDDGMAWSFSAPIAAPSSQQAGASYTFVLADAGTTVEGTRASAQTFTIPTNASVAFPLGTVITVFQAGAGAITVAGASGVTLDGSTLTTVGQFSSIGLRQRAANEWVVTAFAPLASPTFTGLVRVPTAALNDNSTTAASTAYADRAGGRALPPPCFLAQTGTYAPVTAIGLATGSSWAGTNGDWVVYPVSFVAAVTLTSLSVHVANLGTASSVRVGLYADNGGKPGSLVVDGGAVSTATTGDKTLTVSQAVSASTMYWVLVALQGSSTPANLLGIATTVELASSTLAAAESAITGYKIGGTGATGAITGALPGTLSIGTAPAGTALAPLVVAGA